MQLCLQSVLFKVAGLECCVCCSGWSRARDALFQFVQVKETQERMGQQEKGNKRMCLPCRLNLLLHILAPSQCTTHTFRAGQALINRHVGRSSVVILCARHQVRLVLFYEHLGKGLKTYCSCILYHTTLNVHIFILHPGLQWGLPFMNNSCLSQKLHKSQENSTHSPLFTASFQELTKLKSSIA